MARSVLFVYVMQRALPRAADRHASSVSISLVVWVLIALHLTGLLGDVIELYGSHALAAGQDAGVAVGILARRCRVGLTLLVTLWLGSSPKSRLMRTHRWTPNSRVVLARVVKPC